MYVRRRHAEAAQSHIEQFFCKRNVSRHLSADGNVFAVFFARLDDVLYKTQYGRMRFSVEGAYLVVAPVRGERVLGQIVRTNAEKIDEGSEPFRDEGGSRRFGRAVVDLRLFVR